MSTTVPAPVLSVIYAKDILKVASFYQRTLSLPVLEEESNYVVIGNAAHEIAIVRMANSIAAKTRISAPPELREGTPIKCSFWVENLGQVKAEAEAAGGATRPLASAWHWRGQLHLDGSDPEGNIVQFRTRAS